MSESVLFRYIYKELTVSFPNIQGNAIGVRYVRPIPYIKNSRNGDWYYCGDNHAFYQYDKYSDVWVRRRFSKVPSTIRTWCLATGKPMNDEI